VETLPTRDGLNSSALANRVGRCLGAIDPPLSLASISSTISAKALPTLNDPAYKRIYSDGSDVDGPGGLASKADAIITSVGALSEEGYWHDQYIHQWPLATVRPGDVVGDIGGAFVPKNLTKDFRFEPGRPGWIGLSRTILRTVAERGSPGVVVIAAGMNKWRVVEKAVLDKTVSIAIVDHDLADELLQRFEQGLLPSKDR
jgi:DNA-binding transcriptional regulator LsrR (DeoR family)